MSAPITSPNLLATVANLSPSQSTLEPASTETVTVSLSSPITSHLHQSQQQPTVYILKILVRAGKPSWNFIWDISYLRRSLGVVGTFTKPSLSLIVCYWGRMAFAPDSIPRLPRNNLVMNTCKSISRTTNLKHRAVKIIMRQINSLITNKLSFCKLYFVVFWSVFPKLWSYNTENAQNISPPVFFACYFYREKTFCKVLWCFFYHFSQTNEVTNL